MIGERVALIRSPIIALQRTKGRIMGSRTRTQQLAENNRASNASAKSTPWRAPTNAKRAKPKPRHAGEQPVGGKAIGGRLPLARRRHNQRKHKRRARLERMRQAIAPGMRVRVGREVPEYRGIAGIVRSDRATPDGLVRVQLYGSGEGVAGTHSLPLLALRHRVA